jgi:hypothetical protein
VGVALANLVPTLRRTVNPPGQDFYPGTGQAEWRGRLADAFWKARLNDFFSGYAINEDGSEVVPIDSTAEDLGREQQELIVQFAALTAIRNKILSLPTTSRAKAGPVETETQRSAAVLVQMLKDITAEMAETRHIVLAGNAPRAATFFDSMVLAANRLAASYDVYGFVT